MIMNIIMKMPLNEWVTFMIIKTVSYESTLTRMTNRAQGPIRGGFLELFCMVQGPGSVILSGSDFCFALPTFCIYSFFFKHINVYYFHCQF